MSSVCEKCRRRTAVVKASFLNLKLCQDCYINELEKKVKRNISRLKLRKLAQHVFVPYHPLLPLSSLLLFHLMKKIERRFSKKPIIIAIESDELFKFKRDLDVSFLYIDLNDVKSLILDRKREGVAAYWRFTRGAFSKACEEYPNSIMILPGCAEFLAFLDLYSLITGEELSLESRPVISDVDGGLGIVNGFYGVPCNEVITVGYNLFSDKAAQLMGDKRAYDLSKIESVIMRMLQSAVYDRSYEALINIEKSVKFLYSDKEKRRCVYCKGLTRGDRICRYCKGLDEAQIRGRLLE